MKSKATAALAGLLVGIFGVFAVATYGCLIDSVYSSDAFTRPLLVREVVRLRYERFEQSAHDVCMLLDTHLDLGATQLAMEGESEEGREEIRGLTKVAACELRSFCPFDAETDAMLSEVASEQCPGR